MAYGLTKSPLCVAATPSYFKTGASPTGLSITGNITIEAWIKINSLPADRANIVAHNTGAYKEYSLEIEKSDANYNLRLVRSLSDTPTLIVQKASWNPSTGIYYHVATTHNPSTGAANIVVDGTEIATATQTGTVDSTTAEVTIGTFSTSEILSFDGRISLVRIWDTVRSVSDLNTNKCNVFGSAQTNMQAEWSLDNVLTDASGNGNTLTNVNSVVFATDTPSVCAISTTGSLALMGVGM